ncbi:ATP-binding cassette, subfamily F, uup [Verrucomicrobium sp. GAS474]|uniref:ATP-binding cassette domain-containing protein n=1 Tax=Verrucomicrobium sp. GAS474 TaxID=1882831 RepID=UPI000879CBC3|nr:ATP-binding cassette domain-containing protein [Verrucomicrobium sp. GAS474]SDT93329.1 ATP-binding cassette, subfamily F, uup [Verrucomicrobium sp. GAS474]
MPFLQLRGVTLKYDANPLLNAADFQIDAGERVCLLGRNGAGKTSLMRLLTGEETPNSGEVIRQAGTWTTRLDQEVPGNLSGSVIDMIRSGLHPDIETHGHEEQWETDVRLEDLMTDMGLITYTDAPFGSLSGGLKRRVLLAKALAGQPDLLLLDEPTNHLDLASILWLEEFLLKAKPTLFFVTHDRSFLRKLATRIVELDRGKISSWACNYDEYLIRKAAWLEAEEKQWATFDKKLALEEAWIRQGVKARRTRNEGRVRSLEAMRVERSQRRERQGTAKIEVSTGSLSGQKVIEAKDISFSYPNGNGEPIVANLTTTLWRGDKIGLIGPNGGGKTTLLKLLLGKLAPDSGEVKLGTNLQIVYLDQLRDQIDDAKTVAQNVAGDAETVQFQGRAKHIHSYLSDFLFHPDRIRMPAKRLSGGERNRLLLARLFLQPANVLVMDEPTNDLDAETLELLEELLVQFEGTLILVSHDRAFLDNVVTGTLVLEGGGRVGEYIGGYADWLKQSAAEKEATANLTVTSKATSKTAAIPVPKGKEAKMLNKEKRELEELPAQLEAYEVEQAALAAKLADPALYQQDPTGKAFSAVQAELTALEARIATAFSRWEELEAKRAALEAV